MGQGVTYEQIKRFIEDNNYKLISEEYKGCKDKIEVECPLGHRYRVTWNNFKFGKRCPVCGEKSRREKRKLSYESIKEYIENEGYKLISDVYVNCTTKLKIRCPLGHEFEMCYSNFKQGNRCPKCQGCYKYTYEEIKEYIESYKYELLSEEYINSRVKLLLKCPNGHNWEVCYGDFQQGNRCPYCSKRVKYEYQDVKEYIESFGYKLLSTEYINANDKLLILCNKGHKYEATFSKFKNCDRRCPYCAREKVSELFRTPYEEVREYIESFGYELLSDEYTNSQTKLKIKCPLEHEYEVRFRDFKRGSRCPICNISKGERKIMEVLERYEINYIHDNPYFEDLIGIGGGVLRPDFIIENKKIWIEYDGDFHFRKVYYGDSYEMMKIHDELKNEYAKKNGWRLIRIPYWEYDNIEKILEEVVL